MTTKSSSRLWFTVLGTALGAGAMFATGSPWESEALEADLRASQSCPAGEVIDEESTGFQCVPQCPSGMMVDAQTHVCVAAPGVPPAMPEVLTVPTPQI